MPMFFPEGKTKPLGARLEGGKLKRKLQKSLEQLRRHDPDVEVSTEPTEYLFVSNSSVLCGVSPDELQNIFHHFDSECEFVVYPNKRAYSFIKFSSKEQATTAMSDLQGLVHPSLSNFHQPFVIAYVKEFPKLHLDTASFPKNLEVVEEFITADEEQHLIGFFLNNSNGSFPYVSLNILHISVQNMKNRSVLHYGHLFDYSTNSAVDAAEAIPSVIDGLIDRLIAQNYTKCRPDQVTANIYAPGHGIPPHYDTHSAFEESIISLSLASDVVMEFKDGANSARISPVLLKQRSLCVMRGESRYRWKHGIVNRKYDVDPSSNRLLPRKMRISLTFRTIRREPCQCDFKEFCDWDRKGDMAIPETEDLARKLEDSYVSDVYENISSHFDETRHSSWVGVKRFLESLPRYSVLYDVGCGNGKYLIPKDQLIKLGCDKCLGLCNIAYKKNCQVCRSDALFLPFREDADAVICIAVLHHMSSFARRQQLVKEVVRVLKPGGRACITVWSMDQSDSEYAKMRSNKDDSEDPAVDGACRLKVLDGKTFVQQDALVPWTIDSENKTFFRYYHVFREGEMEELVASVPGCQLDSVEREQGNYIACLTKL